MVSTLCNDSPMHLESHSVFSHVYEELGGEKLLAF